MATIEPRDLAISPDSFPFPVWNEVFANELVVVSLTVVILALVSFSYLVNFSGTRRVIRDRREIKDGDDYKWPSLARRNRPMLYILTRVLKAITDGLEQYEDLPSSATS